MGPLAKCELCGTLDIVVERDFRCGGAVGCICPNCVKIVTRWEEAKKRQDAFWKSVLAERKASECCTKGETEK
jgi:hypothetical protein